VVDYSFEWFKGVCQEVGLTYDHVLVSSYLERAKGYAYEVWWWNNQAKLAKRKPTDETEHWLFHEKTKQNAIREFERQAKLHDEKRIDCMLDALDMAEIVKRLPKGLPEYLTKEYTKDGSKIPKV
jgi:hypothetical protein